RFEFDRQRIAVAQSQRRGVDDHLALVAIDDCRTERPGPVRKLSSTGRVTRANRNARSTLECGTHRSPGAATRPHDAPRSSPRHGDAVEQCEHTGNVGVADSHLVIIAPEHVRHSQASRIIGSDTALRRHQLVRHRDIAAATGAREAPHHAGQVTGNARNGHIHGIEAHSAECSVVDPGRERVTDWITEDSEHPGARGDHLAASDLSLATTGSTSFSMIPAEARYSATSPPNGSGMSSAPSAPAYSTSVAALSRPPRSSTRCRCAAVIVRIRSAWLTSSRVSSRARCSPRSRPRSRPTRYEPSDTGEPSHAEVPADETRTFESAGCLAMPSASIAAASG